jgi:hypothetical protein
MSFGWKDENTQAQEKVDAALVLAASKKILIFAAASNDGRTNHFPIAYPANNRDVIPIFSASGLGHRSKFSPQKDEFEVHIATLGEEVLSAFPIAKGKGLMTRMSGTSTATPLAAAITALILRFSRLTDDFSKEERELLKKKDKMIKVLHMIGGKDRHFKWLTPWDWLEAGTKQDIAVARIRAWLY